MSPSEKTDAQIIQTHDRKGNKMTQFRKLVASSAPELQENWKWSIGVWVYEKKTILTFSI